MVTSPCRRSRGWGWNWTRRWWSGSGCRAGGESGDGATILQRHRLGYANGLDIRGRIAQAYGVRAVPETFVLDGRGFVVRYFVGAVDGETLLSAIREARARGGSS